ncbi:MAG: class I SAM-dependent methyltransferase [Alphaproteobacteria bacterium]|nr:class I SAM-dependent methyltransferase [Alphaproteobacteria bacterium]
MQATEDLKRHVHDFWDEASCGEIQFLDAPDKSGFLEQSRRRYLLEPYIGDFAGFEGSKDLDVLEIGVGLGADHQLFAQAGAVLTGVDLTERAIEHTRNRFAQCGLTSDLRVSDAEALPFADNSFDWVYSWGVLHHSPDTARAVDEVKRVLRTGGLAKVMIYHKYSIVGYMLWLRYALLMLKPWRSLSEIYANYLESPGTKAYTKDEARDLFAEFSDVEISIVLTHGDLLESEAGQRHKGWLLTLARRIWPRRIIRWALPGHGLFMLITAIK